MQPAQLISPARTYSAVDPTYIGTGKLRAILHEDGALHF